MRVDWKGGGEPVSEYRAMTKEICERCGKAYEAGPNTHYCKECRKEILSVAAKKRNLSDMGHAARKEKANERIPHCCH